MKFNCHVDIDAPLEKVIQNFDSYDNLNKWQDGFVSYKYLEGIEGEVGSTTELVYKVGKRELVLIETITKKNLPEEFEGRYDFKDGSNTMNSTFLELPNGMTRWTSVVEYTEIHSFMMKMISILFPGMFRKQTLKWMKQFKEMVESQT